MEKTKRARSAEQRAKDAACKRQRRAGLNASGKCREDCGNPLEPGKTHCRPCLDRYRIRHAKAVLRDGCCYRCGRLSASGRRQCDQCLAKGKERDRVSRGSLAGRWLNHATVATCFVAKGTNGRKPRASSGLFNWTHAEFVERFPDFENSGKHLDHVIPRRCAIQTDGAVDEEFARLVLGLDNLQLLTAQQNAFKRDNIDKQILATCKRYREVEGLSGADLFRDLWHQFYEQATNLAAMAAVSVVEEAPVSRWPSIQGLLFQEVAQ